MLLEMTIQNVALIEKLGIAFAPGLNVLTGETGAGKSIVVDSVNLALGARAATDIIRTGEERALVQALFDVSRNPEAILALREMGVEPEEGTLLISRELSRAGRGSVRLNGVICPVLQVRKVTQMLLDVHGQHEHQSLMNPSAHLQYLDAFGDDAHAEKIARYRALYARYGEAGRNFSAADEALGKREQLIDMLSYQIREIDQVKPKPSEDQKLEKREKFVRHAEKITAGVSAAYKLVYDGEGRAPSAQDALKRAADALSDIQEFDERFRDMSAKLGELYYAAQDVGYELRDAMEGLDYNQGEAEKIFDRLNELNRVKRKYGPEIADVLVFREKAQAQLDELADGENHLEALRREREAARAALAQAAEALTQSRAALAELFAERILKELSQLGMDKTRFEVRFVRRGGAEPFAPNGAADAQFYLSPNPGEPLKPLADIASGGELSRIMLALKVAAADKVGVDAMIFDEIDVGISGRMAQIVGEKMAAVARDRQVICVTHLPQIAALADAHFLIEKSVRMGRTDSEITKLDRDGRIRELARMVGGAGDDSSSLQHAAHMLDAAQALFH